MLAVTIQIKSVLSRWRSSRPMAAKTWSLIKVNRKQQQLKSLSQLLLITISESLTVSYLRHFSMKLNYSQIKTNRFLGIAKLWPRLLLSNNSRLRLCCIMAVRIDKRASNCSNRQIDLSNQVSSEIRTKRVRFRHITKTNSYLQIVRKAHSPTINIY